MEDKFTITIKLKDGTLCTGCPVCSFEPALGFWQCIDPLSEAYGIELLRNDEFQPIRPNNCIRQRKGSKD